MTNQAIGLILNDFNKLLNSIELFYKHNNLQLEQNLVSKYDKESFKTKGYCTIDLPNLNERLVIKKSQLGTDYLKRLPNNARKLKNAKEIITISIDYNRKTSKIIVGILQAHENNGYFGINNSESYMFQEVSK